MVRVPAQQLGETGGLPGRTRAQQMVGGKSLSACVFSSYA